MSETLGTIIRSARIAKKLNQRRLAAKVGVDHTYLSKIENDRADCIPSDTLLVALAEVLDLDASYLSRLIGRISDRDKEFFLDLCRDYEEFLPLLRRMRKDPDFAERVFTLCRLTEDPCS